MVGGKDEVMNGFDVFEGALLSTVSGYIYIHMILYDLICIYRYQVFYSIIFPKQDL